MNLASVYADPIQHAIASVGHRHRGQGSLDAIWTSDMKRALEQSASGFGLRTCATGCAFGEWLYDVTWQEWSEQNQLLRIPAVFECEWARDGIAHDFRKLLLARAELRVLIFESRHRAESDRIIEECTAAIGAFGATRAGDEYLFAAWENTPKPEEFYFRSLVI